MTKKEIKQVIRDFTDRKADRSQEYKNITFDQMAIVMEGCAFWTEKHYIRKEILVKYLEWQARYLNGGVDEQELETCMWVMKNKVVMV